MDGPAWIVDDVPAALAWVWRAYWLLIAAVSILCVATAALTLLLWGLGVPVPLPPPVTPPPPATRGATRCRVRSAGRV